MPRNHNATREDSLGQQVACSAGLALFIVLKNRICFFLITCCFFLGSWLVDQSCVQAQPAEPPLRVAVFQCEMTPPLGSMVRYRPLETIEDALLAKGVVLEDRQGRYIVCALDWTCIGGTVHAMLRNKMAAAAGTDATRVALQGVHQHTAPWGEAAVQRLLDQTEDPFIQTDMKFVKVAGERLAEAVEDAVERLEPFDHVGMGKAKVDRVASNRRLFLDGKFYWRGSSTKDATLRELPVGLIDPYLRTVTLAEGKEPLVRVHYFATHPQSFYGDPRACSDVPGFAREKMQQKEGVPQIYFTGCAGDVAMGKYNDGSPAARAQLTQRLFEAMEAAIASTRLVPVDEIQWRVTPVLFPLRKDKGFTVAENRARLADPKLSKAQRTMAARRVAFAERADVPIELSCLWIGPVRILHLPGEPMIAFQLFAQQVAPDAFVVLAENGDWGPGYICTEKAHAEGGYEPRTSMASPEGEGVLESAIRKLLGTKAKADGNHAAAAPAIRDGPGGA